MYWVAIGAGELEGGEDAVGLFNGDAGAGELDNGDELGAESVFTTESDVHVSPLPIIMYFLFLVLNFSCSCPKKIGKYK